MGHELVWTLMEYGFVIPVQITKIAPPILVDPFAFVLEGVIALDGRVDECKMADIRIVLDGGEVRHRLCATVPFRVRGHTHWVTRPVENIFGDAVVGKGDDELLGDLLSSLKFVNVIELLGKKAEAKGVVSGRHRFGKPLPEAAVCNADRHGR